MKTISIPNHYNYIATFLTLDCNLACDYCINYKDLGSLRREIVRPSMSAKEWTSAINRLHIGRDDLPVTFQGGEPTLHKDFYEIVNGVNGEIKLDLLTNLMFDVDEFIQEVPAYKFTREAKYAAIRASYHPGQNNIEDLIAKILKMADAGIYVGLYAVTVPANMEHVKEVQQRCRKLDIDFRTKEYLGFDGKNWHGTYKYPESVSEKVEKYCECKTTELIVDPSGYVFRCHSDLYAKRQPIGHILDPDFQIEDVYRPCFMFGHCNPCDVKVKTNRFQVFGHTSVDIKDIRELNDNEQGKLKHGNFGLGKYMFDKNKEVIRG
ncbi:radical SAM protein [Candidatus Omnitrophota bacterium]